jgi:hypothetical protein
MNVLTPVGRFRRPLLGLTLAAGLLASSLAGVLSATSAHAAGQRVLLRALVVTSGDPATVALATELDREGIPYTKVQVGASGRPTIDAAFLEDAASGGGKFQAVFLPNQAGGGLDTAELSALATYEAAYGVRQVNGYDWPSASLGLATPTYSGPLDGAAVTVSAAGLAGPFTYLKGSLVVDDVDKAVTETYGYLAQPLTTLPAGQTFTPLLTATMGTNSGVLAGVFAHDGREELVLPASFNQNMQWFNEIAPGLVSWATRGIHLGYQRNYFNVQIDDVFLPDSRWSVAGKCTPGDNCVDGTITTTDIRMSMSDVSRLVSWQNANGFKLDMVFNGGGAEAAKAANFGIDWLTLAFLSNKNQFRWINHTYTHPFLGCIQIAPTTADPSWHCATSPTETPRMDPEIGDAVSGGTDWASQATITQQLSDNLAWATTNALPNVDRTELVTGEHSGLATLPQQPNDNPFLAPALSALGIKYAASDASRENEPRALAGGATTTVPRHPMNVFYNAAKYQEEVAEYNWIYASAADGGSGICTANPATSTCITPLAASDNVTAKTSFDSYVKPIEVRNALKFVLTNDPRPFYAHQSNLAEDGVLFGVLEGILGNYRSVFDATRTPLVQTGLTGQSQALSRMNAWKSVSGQVDGYVDGTGVHVPDSSVAVPVTVPAGSTGASLESYAGSLSGWVSGATTLTLDSPSGYGIQAPTTAPGAPTVGTVEPGSTTATVHWTAPASDGGSPVTGYVVRVYTGTATTPNATTISAAADVTSTVVTGLANGTSYRFDVAATNAIGTGKASALSAAVTPKASLAPVPLNVTAEAGNAAATVTWTAPTTTAGITGYRVRAYYGTGMLVAKSVTAAATARSTAVAGLANGTAYTFAVAAVYGSSTGSDSVRSTSVTPKLTSQTAMAPGLSSVKPGPSSVTVTWQAPADASAGTPTGYRVRVYYGTGILQAKSVSFTGTATTGTVPGLLNGIAYSVEVSAAYGSGTGPASARSVAVVPAK